MIRVTSVAIHPLLIDLGQSHTRLAPCETGKVKWSHKDGRVYRESVNRRQDRSFSSHPGGSEIVQSAFSQIKRLFSPLSSGPPRYPGMVKPREVRDGAQVTVPLFIDLGQAIVQVTASW